MHTGKSTMTIHKASAKQTFWGYASHYNLDDPKIRLKVEHTLSVCDLCVRIADSLSLTPEDILPDPERR